MATAPAHRAAAPIEVDLRFTLYAHSPALHIRAEWTNQHRDHRLTVDFPTPLPTTATQAGSTWDIVEHTAPFLQASCRDFVTASAGGRRITILSLLDAFL